MVRSTTIVRASDALPLAASVDDEQVSPNSDGFWWHHAHAEGHFFFSQL